MAALPLLTDPTPAPTSALPSSIPSLDSWVVVVVVEGARSIPLGLALHGMRATAKGTEGKREGQPGGGRRRETQVESAGGRDIEKRVNARVEHPTLRACVSRCLLMRTKVTNCGFMDV